MKIAYPVTVYTSKQGSIISTPGSMSPTAAKCEYCGTLVTATQIKYGDGRGIVYSIATPKNPKPVILSRAYHHLCVKIAQNQPPEEVQS